jgi:hypothetical protein
MPSVAIPIWSHGFWPCCSRVNWLVDTIVSLQSAQSKVTEPRDATPTTMYRRPTYPTPVSMPKLQHHPLVANQLDINIPFGHGTGDSSVGSTKQGVVVMDIVRDILYTEDIDEKIARLGKAS